MDFESTDRSNTTPRREAVDADEDSQTLSERNTDDGKVSDAESLTLGLADIEKLNSLPTKITKKNPRGKRTRGDDKHVSPPTFEKKTVIMHL